MLFAPGEVVDTIMGRGVVESRRLRHRQKPRSALQEQQQDFLRTRGARILAALA